MALTVVTGPPAAGKTTWVAARAKPGDIVIDQDLIAAALTVQGDLHDYGRTIRTIAQSARRAAITEALKASRTLDVYIVHTQPGPTMQQVYRQHGARIITIDPGRDIVLARCRTERPRAVLAAVQRWYSDHERHHTVSHASSRAW